jgi:hypothetical protein
MSAVRFVCRRALGWILRSPSAGDEKTACSGRQGFFTVFLRATIGLLIVFV